MLFTFASRFIKQSVMCVASHLKGFPTALALASVQTFLHSTNENDFGRLLRMPFMKF